MTREQAITKLRKLYGQRFYWCVGKSVTSPEKRQAARESREQMRARIAAIDTEIKDRLAQLDWYQALVAEKRQLRKAEEQATYDMLRYKFQVGKRESIFTHITGSGDTWEEAIAQAERRDAKSA